jgi:hypothetical protein
MGVPLLDPLVWNIELPLHSGDKTFVNVLSVLLMMLFVLRMILTIIRTKDQIWSNSAAIWQAIVTFFISKGPMMMEMIEEAWYYISQNLAPLPSKYFLITTNLHWRTNHP